LLRQEKTIKIAPHAREGARGWMMGKYREIPLEALRRKQGQL
jgi:hypothetical protein